MEGDLERRSARIRPGIQICQQPRAKCRHREAISNEQAHQGQVLVPEAKEEANSCPAMKLCHYLKELPSVRLFPDCTHSRQIARISKPVAKRSVLTQRDSPNEIAREY